MLGICKEAPFHILLINRIYIFILPFHKTLTGYAYDTVAFNCGCEALMHNYYDS